MSKPTPDAPAPATITITETELTARIAAAIAAATGVQAGSNLTVEQRVAVQVAQERPRGEAPDYVPCISRPEYGGTGATWLAVVVKERVGKDDLGRTRAVPSRVVDLHHYLKPADWMDRLPEGSKKAIADNKGELPGRMKVDVWQSYYAADLRANVGKPLNPAYRASAEEIASLHLATEPEVGGSRVGSAEAA
jgi:hypothetical protein